MRLPFFSWTNLLRRLGFSRRRRPITTAQLKREACFRPSCEMLESRDLLAAYSIMAMSAMENAGTMTFMVSRGGDLSAAGSVDWATAADPGGAAPATAGTDYTSGNGTLNFAANEISKNVTVNLTGDTTYEANETFLVNLSNPSSGDTITTGQATGTISNDDSMPTVSFDPTSVTVSETAGTATFTIKLSAASGVASSVQYASMGLSATSGVDFTSTSGTANFAAGDTTKTVTVPIINDTTYEGATAENYSLSLSNPTNVSVGSGTATGYITDNDSQPTISINDVSVNESASSAVFNVTLSNASYLSISVTAAAADGTATGGYIGAVDYQPIMMGMVSFNPGETSKNVSVTINNDTLKESDETFHANLSSPSNATIADSQGDGTILDNDATGRTNVDDQPLAGGADYHVGNLQLRRELPGGLALRYNSITSPRPLITVETVQPENSSIPSQIKAELFYNGSLASTVYYNTTGLTAGAAERFVLQADATALASGTYDWSLKLTETVGSEKSYRTFTGRSTIVNRDSSPYGRDWWLEGLDQLVIETGAVSVIYASGSTARYVSDGSGGYTKPAGYTEALTKNADNTYTLRAKDGTKLEFDTAGKLTKRTDRNGNATATYTYTSGLLTKIKDLFGGETTLSYSGGLLQSITDPAGRVATCGYSSGKLTSITYPDPDNGGSQTSPVWNYTYHSTTGLLTAEQDPRGNSTSFQWGAAGRFSGRVLPGNLSYGLTPIATVGWIDVASGSGTSGNPAAIPKPADAKATLTDPLSRNVYITTDRFGGPLTYKDALGNTNTYQRNSDGRPTQWTSPDPDGAGPLTPRVYAYSYDTSQNLTQLTAPDNSTQQFTYDSTYNQLTSQTDELGHQTLYTVSATNGNTTQSRQVVGQVDSQQNGETNDLVWSYTYTAAPTAGSLPGGLLTDATDPLGRVTHYVYQTNTAAADFGQVTSVVSAYGTSSAATTSYEYDSAHNLTAQVDPLGFRTVYAYDNLGRQTSVTEPDPDAGGSLTSPVTTYVYDAAGNVTSQTDPRGFVTSYQYDSLNRLTVQTLPDPDGAGSLTSPVTTYTYDSAGRLTDVTDALGGVTSYQYNANDWKTGEDLPDPDGAGSLTRPHVTYTYDTLGRLTSSTDPLGNTAAYEYNARGLKTKETAPDPDGAGSLTSPVTQFAYNAAGQVTSQTDPLGRVTTFAYNDLGQLVSRTDPDPDGAGSLTSPVTTFTYDKAGNVLTETDPLGRVTTHAYDALNRRVSSTLPDPDGGGSQTSPVTTYAYDSGGRLTSVTDPLDNVTAYLYDNLGRQTRVTRPDPDGAGSLAAPQTNYTYDAAGNVLTVSDPLSRVTTYEYDNLGRQTKITAADPDGAGSLTSPDTTYAYDAAGNLTGVTDPLGNTTAYEYDKLSRQTKETQPDPDGAGSLTSPVTTYVYDSASRLTSVTDPLGRTTTFGYDNLGRKISVTEPDPDGGGSQTSPVTTYAYDAAGQLTGATNPLGKTTNYEYDNLGRKTKDLLPDPDGAGSLGRPTTTYTYDAVSNLTKLTDPVGNDTTWAFDNLNRTTSETNELNHARTFEYDAAGRVTKRTDRTGDVIEYAYDNLGRLTTETWKTGGTTVNTLVFAYDAASQMTSASDADSSYTDVYDALGRLTQETVANDGAPTVELNQKFDAAGNRTELAARLDHGSGFRADLKNSYTYDPLGRMTRVDQTGVSGGNAVAEKRADFTYNAVGDFTSISRYKDTDGGSTHLIATSNYSYDGVGRLTDLTHVRDTTTFADYNWTYDAHGRVTGMQFTSLVGDDGSSNYTYDNTDQLTATDHDYQANEASSFDENGNQTGTGYTTGADNRLTSDGTFNYGYDNEGRRTLRTRISSALADDYTTEYDYDHRSRLAGVTFKNNSGTVTKDVSFVYDVFDRRIAEMVDPDGAGSGAATSDYFIFDPHSKLDPATRTALHDVLLVIDGEGGIEDRYLQGPGIDQTLADEQYATPTEQPTAVGDLFYLLADSLGTIRDVIQWDATQQIVLVKNHLTYDAWGIITGETDTSLNTRYGFQGRERDEATGLNYHRQRWYDPKSKTWITPDPRSFRAGDTNLYRPMGNGLTNRIDPSGLTWENTPHWHHLVPQELKNIFGDKLDEAWNGWFLRAGDHSALHSAGWNTDWNKWVDSFPKANGGRAPGLSDAKKFMRELMAEPKGLSDYYTSDHCHAACRLGTVHVPKPQGVACGRQFSVKVSRYSRCALGADRSGAPDLPKGQEGRPTKALPA